MTIKGILMTANMKKCYLIFHEKPTIVQPVGDLGMLADSLDPVIHITYNSCFRALFMRRLLNSKSACGLAVYNSRQ